MTFWTINVDWHFVGFLVFKWFFVDLAHCVWCRWRNGLWFLLIWDINHQEDQKRKKMETLLIWRKESRNFFLSQTTSQKDHWCVNAFNPWILWIQVFFRLSTMYYTITNTTQEKKLENSSTLDPLIAQEFVQKIFVHYLKCTCTTWFGPDIWIINLL